MGKTGRFRKPHIHPINPHTAIASENSQRFDLIGSPTQIAFGE